MFKHAIKINLAYTRPLLIGEKEFGSNKINSGIATFIILNKDGYILTCKHVAKKIEEAEKLNQKYHEYLKQEANAELNKRYSYKANTVVQIRNVFINCFTDGELEKIIYHKALDLALIKFSNFSEVKTDIFPTFSLKALEPGESICRLGFPWPIYNCFQYNKKKHEIEIDANGNFATPAFPLDGMITRLLENNGEIVAFEASTPGLRGQSGGPVFDTNGSVLGLQSATTHLDLMFDIECKLKNKKMLEKQFINLGIAISSNQITKFLDENDVFYNKTI